MLPDIEYPNNLIGSWDDRPLPAGFGPIPGHWPPRAVLAGTYDDKWMKGRQPLLRDDVDDRFFQCAPVGQQSPDFLRSGAVVELRNLTPSGDLRFILPRVFLRFETPLHNGERAAVWALRSGDATGFRTELEAAAHSLLV